MIPLPQSTPTSTGGTSSPEAIVNSSIMESPNVNDEPITATTSGDASPVSANSHGGDQTSTLQSSSNSSQQAEMTSSASPPMANPSEMEWRDNWLHPGRLAVLFLVTLGIIGTIATCSVISREKNGIVQVSDSTITIDNYKVGPALAWTTLPVFLITLYGMAFGAVVAACSSRQPYAELWAQDQDSGSPLNQSILLDYRAHSMWTQPWVAIKNKHLLLVIAIIFASIVNLLLTSLAAHLFDSVIVDTSVPRTVMQNTTFNPSGFTYRTDLVPIFDIVSSTLVYRGTPPAWTTSSYSMLTFPIPPSQMEILDQATFLWRPSLTLLIWIALCLTNLSTISQLGV